MAHESPERWRLGVDLRFDFNLASYTTNTGQLGGASQATHSHVSPRWEIDMNVLPHLFAGVVFFAASLSIAAPLKAGQACELGDRAKLFSAQTGDEFVAKLDAKTTVTLSEFKKGRWLVSAGDKTGYIDAKWLKKICSVVKPVADSSVGEKATPAAASEAPAAEEPELELTLDMPAEAESKETKTEPPVTEEGAKGDATTAADNAEAAAASETASESAPKVADTPKAAETPKTEAAPSASEQSATPAPAESATKVVNKPKLADVIRPAFALHDSFLGDKRARVVVLDTRVDAVASLGLDGSGMAAIISAELTKLVDGKADVVARSDMATLIQRMEEAQLMGCSEPSCMTDIATLAEADLLVSSNVTPAGEGFTLALELLQADSGRALRRETVTWTGSTKGLVELCAPQVVKLVGAKQGQAFSGAVQLVATEDEAEVYVDEQLVGVTPLDIFPNLDIGKHTIRVSKPGYKLFEIPVVVNRDGTSVVQAELIKPWYNEWWVWTAAGSILAGSVTAYILANQGEDPTLYEVNTAISGSLGGTSR
jgi:hypothetical protein